MSRNDLILKQGELVTFINEQYQLNRQLDHRINDHEERLVVMESNSEITTAQGKELKQAVARKVYSLLSKEDMAVYGRKLFADCWKHLRTYGCGHPYTTTPKREFENVMKALKNYNPDIAVIKIEHDRERQSRLANDKRLLEELGYKS